MPYKKIKDNPRATQVQIERLARTDLNAALQHPSCPHWLISKHALERWEVIEQGAWWALLLLEDAAKAEEVYCWVQISRIEEKIKNLLYREEKYTQAMTLRRMAWEISCLERQMPIPDEQWQQIAYLTTGHMRKVLLDTPSPGWEEATRNQNTGYWISTERVGASNRQQEIWGTCHQRLSRNFKDAFRQQFLPPASMFRYNAHEHWVPACRCFVENLPMTKHELTLAEADWRSLLQHFNMDIPWIERSIRMWPEAKEPMIRMEIRNPFQKE